MTEREWNKSSDPVAMLYFLAGGSEGLEGNADLWVVSSRKFRLTACAFSRYMMTRWVPYDQKVADLVGIAELVAEGTLGSKDRGMAFNRTDFVHGPQGTYIRGCLRSNAADGSRNISLEPVDFEGEISAIQARILRDIIGNPFQPVVCRTKEPCWFTPLVLQLAEAAYTVRTGTGTLDNDALAVLSDALEDAGLEDESRLCRLCNGTGIREYMATYNQGSPCVGCDGVGMIRQLNPILAHLREPGPHYRGCWAVDLILGKE